MTYAIGKRVGNYKGSTLSQTFTIYGGWVETPVVF